MLPIAGHGVVVRVDPTLESYVEVETKAVRLHQATVQTRLIIGGAILIRGGRGSGLVEGRDR